MRKVVGYASPKSKLALTKVSKSTRRVAKPNFQMTMNNMTKLKISKTKMITNLTFLFQEIYEHDWTREWHNEFLEYMQIMGVDLDYNLFEGLITTAQGFNKLMTKLNINTLQGFYSWMNGRLLDYMKMNHIIATVSMGEETKKQFAKRATNYMKRPTPQIGAWN